MSEKRPFKSLETLGWVALLVAAGFVVLYVLVS